VKIEINTLSMYHGVDAYYRQGTVVHLRDLPRSQKAFEGESAVVIAFHPAGPGWVCQLEGDQWRGKQVRNTRCFQFNHRPLSLPAKDQEVHAV
jgi:hypothetical protein